MLLNVDCHYDLTLFVRIACASHNLQTSVCVRTSTSRMLSNTPCSLPKSPFLRFVLCDRVPRGLQSTQESSLFRHCC